MSFYSRAETGVRKTHRRTDRRGAIHPYGAPQRRIHNRRRATCHWFILKWPWPWKSAT